MNAAQMWEMRSPRTINLSWLVIDDLLNAMYLGEMI